MALFDIEALLKKLVLLVSHGISLSLNPPPAAVKFDSATGSGRVNSSVRLTRLAHKKFAIHRNSQNFALPSSATGGGRAQFILD